MTFATQLFLAPAQNLEVAPKMPLPFTSISKLSEFVLLSFAPLDQAIIIVSCLHGRAGVDCGLGLTPRWVTIVLGSSRVDSRHLGCTDVCFM